jgi:hypothetical protein
MILASLVVRLINTYILSWRSGRKGASVSIESPVFIMNMIILNGEMLT